MQNSPGAHACGACKYQRKRCGKDCLLAPHFPSDAIDKWRMVQDTFGAANVKTMLADLEPERRNDFARSIIFEAEARVLDPVYGTLRIISKQQEQLTTLQKKVSALQEEATTLRQQLHGHLSPSDRRRTAGSRAGETNIVVGTPDPRPSPGLVQRENSSPYGLAWPPKPEADVLVDPLPSLEEDPLTLGYFDDLHHGAAAAHSPLNLCVKEEAARSGVSLRSQASLHHVPQSLQIH